jgi:glycosyltransferase involved in cell wall biosynthesis
LFGRIKNYVFYSHEQFAIFLLTFISSKTFYEIHDFPGNQVIYRCLFKRIRGIVTTNKWKAEELAKRFSTPKHSILTVPNAVDLESFSNDLKIEEMRKKLNLPLSDYLIGYVGALKTMGMEKGLTTAILALEFLPTNYKLYIIGGDSDEDMEYYKTFANGHHFLDRVIFAGHVPHKDIPTYISACNSLIAPFPENDHYSYYMSPMKIFEYMASKRPIILTDLPSLREILKDGETALFVPPSDSKALSGAIEKVAKDNELGHRLSENAYREVREKYTWVKRAEKILTFLRQF